MWRHVKIMVKYKLNVWRSQVAALCQSAYYELRKISTISYILSSPIASIQICVRSWLFTVFFAFVLSSILHSQTGKHRPLQHIWCWKQGNRTVSLLSFAPFTGICTQNKLSVLCFHLFEGTYPAYLYISLTLSSPSSQPGNCSSSKQPT